MSSEAPPPPALPEDDASAGHWSRLHPLSFLFTLLTQLRQFAIPLLVLIFTGQRNDNDLWSLIGVVVLAFVSIGQYFTYRYRIDRDGVVIRSGLFQRSLRHIPFARIQNVSLHQGILHRLFDVAEVRLESAGAQKPEGQMRVLRLRDAQALEQQIRDAGAQARRFAAATAAGTAALPGTDACLDATSVAASPDIELHALSFGDLVRVGLISNRGMIVVGGAFAVLAQSGDNQIGEVFKALAEWFQGQANAWHLSVLATAAAGVVLLLAALAAVRLLSVALAIFQFYGFRLSESDGRLTVVRGLTTRVRSSLPRHRIQAWALHEGVLHRWFHRRGLRVDTAVTEVGDQGRSPRDLVPIATPQRMDELLAHLLPPNAWPVPDWSPLHARAWVPALLPSVVFMLAGTAAAIGWWGWPGLGVLALAPLLLWRARLWARRSAWAVAGGLVAFRSGWLDRRWRFAEVRKLQALELVQGPLLRRLGMATLRFDTAGASPFESPLAFPFIPEARARELYAELSESLRGRRRAPFGPAGLTRSRTAASAAPGG